MKVEMGRVSKEAAQGKVVRKQLVYEILSNDETKSKDGVEDGIVAQGRKLLESTEGQNREETTPLRESDTGGVDRDKDPTDPEENEMKASQVQAIFEDSDIKQEEYKANPDVLKGFKCCSEEMVGNFQEPDSRSKSTYVKLWAHKESKQNDQISPKRLEVQIGSLSCENTHRFLEAEKARVIREIRKEQEKRLGRSANTRLLVGTSGKRCKELEHKDSAHQDKEGKALRSHSDRAAEPMESEEGDRGPTVKEQKRAEDRATEDKEKQRTEGHETVSDDLRSLPISGGEIRQNGGKEQRFGNENWASGQPEAKAPTFEAEQDNRARVFSGQLTGTREQTEAIGKKRPSIRPIFETVVKKNDRRASEHPKENKGGTSTSHLPSSSDSKSYISCQGDKWAGRFVKHAAPAAEVDKGTQQGEGPAEEKELQMRALFHLEALRRIEETYNSRINRERSNFRTKRPNEMPLRHPEYWDNKNFYSGVLETPKNQLRKLQQKGQGGLNALLSPVFEEEIQRQWQNLDENSPTNSYTEKQVLMFQRMKKARLRAAEEEIAAIKARAQQRRAQLKTTMEKVALGRVMETANKKQKGIGGKCFKAQKENLPTKLTQGRLFTNTLSNNLKTLDQSVKRINKVNEKTRAEEELETGRHRRDEVEEQRTRLRRAGPDRAYIELYGRLNRNDKTQKLVLPSQVNYRFKSSLDSSQKFNDSNMSKHPRFRPHTINSRFRSLLDRSPKLNGCNRFKHPQLANGRFESPLTSPRKAIKTNALEHFANWEKELRTAQRSRSRSKDRSTERRVAVKEDPFENSELKSGRGAIGHLYTNDYHSKSPQRNQNSETILSNEAIPDHYNSVDEDCTCELKHKKGMKDKTRLKAIEEKTPETADGAHRRENCRSLSWLGKLYNTITSFS